MDDSGVGAALPLDQLLTSEGLDYTCPSSPRSSTKALALSVPDSIWSEYLPPGLVVDDLGRLVDGTLELVGVILSELLDLVEHPHRPSLASPDASSRHRRPR